MSGPHWLVLTGAVTPDPLLATRTWISDAGVRADQYRAAISHYAEFCRETGTRLVFIETSDHEPRQLIPQALLEEIRWLAFPTTGLTLEERARGKGAIEAAAVDAFVDTLEPRDGSRLTKVTGRLVVSNLDKQLNGFSASSIVVRRTIDRRYCDTRLFSVPVEFWRNRLYGMKVEVDEGGGRFLEHVIAHRLVAAEYAGAAQVSSFTRRPVFNGVSGENGDLYGPVLEAGKMWADRAVRPLLTRARDRQL